MRRLIVALAALMLLAGCDITGMILSPPEGTIVSTATVPVSGVIPDSVAGGGTLTVNGIATTVNPDRTWAANVPATAGKYVTPILAKYVAPGGAVWTQRTAVVNGPKLDEGQASPNGVGMRFTNTGSAPTMAGPLTPQPLCPEVVRSAATARSSSSASCPLNEAYRRRRSSDGSCGMRHRRSNEQRAFAVASRSVHGSTEGRHDGG